MKNKTIFYAIINWGLGHATRSAPIIRHLLERGNRIVLISHGKALTLLREMFPDCEYADILDRQVSYSHYSFMFVFKIVAQLPKMLLGWRYEHKKMQELEKRYRPDLIISEMRLGIWSKHVPSVLITHQLRFYLPPALRWAAVFGEWFNRIVFRKYRYVFVPDAEGSPNLSGVLSHKGKIAGHPKVRYIGCLSSIEKTADSKEDDIDLLISISGPEPQRSRFETRVMEQVEKVPGKIWIALGEPGDAKDKTLDKGRIRIFSHLDRKAMAEAMLQAKYIVCRSGYSTVMELLALGKNALLVPTPGQTEQEYLADYYREQGIFHSCTQQELDLEKLPKLPGGRSLKEKIPVNRLDHIEKLLDSLCQ
jgi:UDP:flavonoid glycosyltransferase YjiC (YdhE family)